MQQANGPVLDYPIPLDTRMLESRPNTTICISNGCWTRGHYRVPATANGHKLSSASTMATNRHIDKNSVWSNVMQGYNALDDDQKFWWTATAPSLNRLLANSGYDDVDQLKHLQWYRDYILKALGPRPRAGQKALFEPCPVFDGSAVEHSINWKEHSEERLVRFTIEAVSHEAGTDSDPYNQDASIHLLRRLHQDFPAVDLQRFDTFSQELFLRPDTREILQHKLPPGAPLSQIWMAFDLHHGGEVLTKVYFMPVLKWILTGIPTKTLVFDAIRRVDSKFGSFEVSTGLLGDYFDSFPPERSPVIEMVAIDCMESPKARIKCYLRTGVNTLAKAKHQFTLGGRLTGETMQRGVQALEELWPILFRIDTGDVENTEVFPGGNYCGCAVEMKPGTEYPETKLHIPVRKISGTDAQLCESLSTWFRRRGDSQFAQVYKDQLKSAFPDHDLDRTGGTHTFISFSYSMTHGVYMTMYYSTKIMEVHLKKNQGDIWSGYDNLWIERGGLQHHKVADTMVH